MPCLTARQKEELKMLFVEGKWCYNAILNYGGSSSIFDYDTKSKTVVHKDKDGNDIECEYAYLPQSLRQTIHTQIKNSIRVLAARKKKGLKVGSLKYISELKALEFKQYGVTHKIPRMNRIKLQGIKGLLKVNGMDQFYGNPDYEIANVKLLNRPDGHSRSSVSISALRPTSPHRKERRYMHRCKKVSGSKGFRRNLAGR